MIAARLRARELGRRGVASALALMVVGLPQQRRGPRAPADAHTASPSAVARNPRHLSAVQLLEPTRPGHVPHVRFEWDQVPNASGYLLFGSWANADSWTIQSREFRVTPHSATEWDSSSVAFDAALPEGSHSWNVVALFGTDSAVDRRSPTLLSFELR